MDPLQLYVPVSCPESQEGEWPSSRTHLPASGHGMRNLEVQPLTDQATVVWGVPDGPRRDGQVPPRRGMDQKNQRTTEKGADVRCAAGNVSNDIGGHGSRKERKHAGMYLMPDRIYEKYHMILTKWMESCSLKGDFSSMYRVPDNGNVSVES